MTPIQLTLFPEPHKQVVILDSWLTYVERDGEEVRVATYPENGYFRATIAGGWWMATGKTVKEAARNVIARYEGER